MRKLILKAIAAVPVILMFGVQNALADNPMTEEWTTSFVDYPIQTCEEYNFDILATAKFTYKQLSFFDKDGILTRIRVRWTLDEGSYKNSADPTKILDLAPGWGANQWIDVHTGDRVQTGAYSRVVAPGYGVLALGVGRLEVTVNDDGTVTRTWNGKANFIEGDLAKLCAYMY
jgi:hypothetical protein